MFNVKKKNTYINKLSLFKLTIRHQNNTLNQKERTNFRYQQFNLHQFNSPILNQIVSILATRIVWKYRFK